MTTPLGNPYTREQYRKFLTSSTQKPSTLSVPVLSTTFRTCGFSVTKPSMTILRRAPSCRNERFCATSMLRDSASLTEASFSLSCLIFADSSSTCGVARAKLCGTKASPNRPFLMSSSPFEIFNHSVVTQAANTSTQTNRDSGEGECATSPSQTTKVQPSR